MEIKSNQRIAFIDLAKGIGIILVVIGHAYSIGVASDVMPLFYFLSGYFFSMKKTFYSFIISKINKNLVPMAFFILLSLPIFGYLISYDDIDIIYLYYQTRNFILLNSINMYSDAPVWFLFSLCTVSIIYYGLSKISTNSISLLVFSFTLPIFGIVLSKYFTNSFWIFTSLTVLPFYSLGNLLNKTHDYIDIIMDKKSKKILIYISLMLICIVCYHNIDFAKNSVKNETWFVVFSSFISYTSSCTLFYYLSRMIENSNNNLILKLIQFIGNNSIIILGVHFPLQIMVRIWGDIPLHPSLCQGTVVFISSLIISFALIFVLKKYFAKLIGAKDLFSINC